jgi:hypothetical protein
MLKSLTFAAFALGIGLASGSAVAQNIEGPGAPNYGAGSSPQTGGTVTPVRPSPQTQPSSRPALVRRRQANRVTNRRMAHTAGSRYGALGSQLR